MARAHSASFLRVFFLLFSLPSLLSSYPLGSNLLTNQPVAIKFVSPSRTGCNFSAYALVVAKEPRKSDAPQLRDEFRSYRTLNGTRMSSLPLSVVPHSNRATCCPPAHFTPTGAQSAFPKCIISAKRGYTMSSRSTFWVPILKTCLTCVVASLLSRRCAWPLSKW